MNMCICFLPNDQVWKPKEIFYMKFDPIFPPKKCSSSTFVSKIYRLKNDVKTKVTVDDFINIIVWRQSEGAQQVFSVCPKSL